MATGRVPTTANSPLTAKGDLFGYSTAPARLAVGNDGEQIVADSSTSTGLRYQGILNASNPVLNSSFDVWQRGTSLATAATASNYTADRWIGYRGVAGGTVSRQLTNDTTNLPFIQYCARVQRDSGNTSTSAVEILQPFESVNAIPFAGRTVTMSFYARKGANFSAASDALNVRLVTGTGTDQNPITTYTGSANTINTTVTLTSTWQRFSVSATLPATVTEFYPDFYFTPVGTAGAADFFEITGIAIDLGSVALPYRRNSGTIQGELAACQRYYFRNAYNGTGSGTYLYLGDGQATGTTTADIRINFPVTMRNEPQAVDYSGLIFGVWANTIAPPVTAISIYQSRRSSNLCILSVTASTANLTAGDSYYLLGNGSGTSYVGLSAEL
jgi:hypothetical protein